MTSLKILIPWAFLFGHPGLSAAQSDSGSSRVGKCEAGIRSYLAFEKKGRTVVEGAAPLGAGACRDAVGDVEQTTVVLASECGTFPFEKFESPLKAGLQKVRGVMPSDTVSDVISKARFQHIKALKSFCGMEPPPVGVTQDAADCSWFIDVQLKYFKKLGSILAGLAANSAKSCIQRYEIIKNSRLQVPEACRRYTMETFPGEDVKVRMVELWSDSGRTPNPGENVADAFVKLRANGLPGLRKLCDSGAR